MRTCMMARSIRCPANDAPPDTTTWRCSRSTGIALRRRRALNSSIAMPLAGWLRCRDQPATRRTNVGEQFDRLGGQKMHRPRVGVGPAAADRCIAQESDVMSALRRVDGGRKTSLVGAETGERKARAVRHDVVEQAIGVAGWPLQLEHHVGPPGLESGNPGRALETAVRSRLR